MNILAAPKKPLKDAEPPVPVREVNPIVIPEVRKERSEALEVEIGLKTAGQRRINLIWEYTQAFIAGTVVSTVLFVAAMLAISVNGATAQQVAAFVFLTGVANLVIGFYFGRTNHQRQGGVGSHEGER